MTPEPLPKQFYDAERIFNLRDLGGWDAAGGRKVRTGRVFRSDALGLATDADLELLVDRLGVKHVIDLRRTEELEEAGRFEAEGVEFHHFELQHIRWEAVDIGVDGRSPREAVVGFLRQRYSGMYEAGFATVRDALEVIASGEPVLFHCMAGKDRTGLIAAALLTVLGVSAEDIAADYALSSVGIARWRAWYESQAGEPAGDRGMTTPPEAMRETLAEMEARFGSMSAYIEATGFDRQERLRDLLLE